MSYLTAERRPSMVERRASMDPQSRPLFIPHLAGLEKPFADTIPTETDVLVIGTGLTESILAASLAWSGSEVLHIDANSYYGDTTAALTIDQIKQWVQHVNSGASASHQNYRGALLYIPRPSVLQLREYLIDLTPKFLFAKSDLLDLLVKSRVFQYLEFQSLSSFHVFENDCFEKMNNSKESIFTDQSLTLATKRHLMKFLKFVLEYPETPELWHDYADKPLTQFISERYKLDGPQINEIVFSIALSTSTAISTAEGLQRIRRSLTSYDIYGKFPVLVSKYGGPGEVSQGFCRSAAVAGATYKLGNSMIAYDAEKKLATFNDGSRVVVKEKIVCSQSQVPQNLLRFQDQKTEKVEITRLIAIVEKDCAAWFAENEHSAFVVFPPDSLQTAVSKSAPTPATNKTAVQIIIQGAGAGVVPAGQCLWSLTTTTPGDAGRRELEAALMQMEKSLLRESDEEYELAVTPNDVIYNAQGTPIINSLRVGDAFKGFAPREKLTYLFKLMFSQLTAASGVTSDVLFTEMPSAEISYDGFVAEARALYERITGSSDDFFDVDFEDEDEEMAAVEEDESMDVDEADGKRSRRGSSARSSRNGSVIVPVNMSMSSAKDRDDEAMRTQDDEFAAGMDL
ncbi:hypothetical protein BABINDRAFT_163596 [Babjeviella inositovora NRRL Y-12698]|uniref:Rab proteins geranylgeranyltransferase n=1 Tax=Babjeviella inositovora NRRL Y-12698 TaxID=984486 RepID=A0A1E3QK11_9ASCO|nr:uncharacterized protein BABINDRAFT_163596 [Babjeviella inositovora NRRL Y-12698]ODQ77337.1 hypothetical protein BABINDRAFT_163596 [Babjeviella inositovora NRRL Y-12698]